MLDGDNALAMRPVAKEIVGTSIDSDTARPLRTPRDQQDQQKQNQGSSGSFDRDSMPSNVQLFLLASLDNVTRNVSSRSPLVTVSQASHRMDRLR